MLQVVIDKDLLFDLKNYADDNGLKYTDIVRQLIRTEVYQRQTLAKRVITSLSKATKAPETARKSKKVRR